MPAEADVCSEDAVLDGSLILRQPLRGHRVGHDAILLAAATAACAGEHAVDLGAGVGGAGLALARRVEGLTVTLVEQSPDLVELGRVNAARNGLAQRVRSVCLDVGASATAFAAAGLEPGEADRVLMNPPFNAAQNPSPDASRRLAHVATEQTLQQWVNVAARLLRPQGTLTVIWRADCLAQVIESLAGGFGATAILPIYSKPDKAAVRVLTRAVKASRAPLMLLPGLLLADAGGRPTPQAEAVLRGNAILSLDEN